MSSKIEMGSLFPLALLTGIAMLATDLYLPAVPSLPQTLGGTIQDAQYTLSGFLAALAFGQLLWGWTCDRFGESFTITVGTILLIVGGVACAFAPNIYSLILARVIQGLGAGAATVAVPSLIRKKFSEVESVQAMGAVASIEAIVPALGPILGAGLIALFHWRVSFALLALVTFLLFPFLVKIVGKTAPDVKKIPKPLFILFKNWGFLRFALSYSFMFGALILMVMTSPQIIVSWFSLNIYYFSILQVAGVTAFILVVRKGGNLVESKGMAWVVQFGMWLQSVSCFGFLALAIFEFKSFVGFTFFWCLFCAGLALRGPSSMTRALSYAGEMAGQASGLLMFLAFGICSAATTFVAQYLQQGLLLLAITSLGMTLVSGVFSLKIRDHL